MLIIDSDEHSPVLQYQILNPLMTPFRLSAGGKDHDNFTSVELMTSTTKFIGAASGAEREHCYCLYVTVSSQKNVY